MNLNPPKKEHFFLNNNNEKPELNFTRCCLLPIHEYAGFGMFYCFNFMVYPKYCMFSNTVQY